MKTIPADGLDEKSTLYWESVFPKLYPIWRKKSFLEYEADDNEDADCDDADDNDDTSGADAQADDDARDADTGGGDVMADADDDDNAGGGDASCFSS